MDTPDTKTDISSSDSTTPESAPAWEMISPGRYRPRRIRGSCLGRELG